MKQEYKDCFNFFRERVEEMVENGEWRPGQYDDAGMLMQGNVRMYTCTYTRTWSTIAKLSKLVKFFDTYTCTHKQPMVPPPGMHPRDLAMMQEEEMMRMRKSLAYICLSSTCVCENSCVNLSNFVKCVEL